jgi:hypothetical protein
MLLGFALRFVPRLDRTRALVLSSLDFRKGRDVDYLGEE